MVDWLLACPEKGWFRPLQSESTDEIEEMSPVNFLVDANVLSEATKPQPAPSVVDWLRAHERRLVVNPIILGELEYGILLLPAGRRERDSRMVCRRREKVAGLGPRRRHGQGLGRVAWPN